MPNVFIITSGIPSASLLLKYTEAFKLQTPRIALCYGEEPKTGYQRVGHHFQKIDSSFSSEDEYLGKENNFTVLFSILVVTPINYYPSDAGSIRFGTGEPYNLLNHSKNAAAVSIQDLAKMLLSDVNPNAISSDHFGIEPSRLAANPQAMRNFVDFIEKRIAESGISIKKEVLEGLREIFDVNYQPSLKIIAEQSNVQPMISQYNSKVKEEVASNTSSTNNNNTQAPKPGI